MNRKNVQIVIIGGGLTGLSLAYFLELKGISSLIIEARKRLGGRIYTKYNDGQAPIELGATWFGTQHTHLALLLKELGISSFKQELGNRAVYEPISTSPAQLVTLPPNNDPSYRVVGGSTKIIEALQQRVVSSQIELGQEVESIQFENSKFKLTTSTKQFESDIVISTLPPNLLSKSISILPALPKELDSLLKATHTWMGESIKVALTYKDPFWRDASSGTMFSNVGPISELYDHSNKEDNYFALKGFMNGGFHGASKELRLQYTLKQLERYYGKAVHNYLSYSEKVWRNDTCTFVDYDSYMLPHQNNGISSLRKPLFENQFFIAGSETAPSHPGYMDGAVESARIVSDLIINHIQVS